MKTQKLILLLHAAILLLLMVGASHQDSTLDETEEVNDFFWFEDYVEEGEESQISEEPMIHHTTTYGNTHTTIDKELITDKTTQKNGPLYTRSSTDSIYTRIPAHSDSTSATDGLSHNDTETPTSSHTHDRSTRKTDDDENDDDANPSPTDAALPMETRVPNGVTRMTKAEEKTTNHGMATSSDTEVPISHPATDTDPTVENENEKENEEETGNAIGYGSEAVISSATTTTTLVVEMDQSKEPADAGTEAVIAHPVTRTTDEKNLTPEHTDSSTSSPSTVTTTKKSPSQIDDPPYSTLSEERKKQIGLAPPYPSSRQGLIMDMPWEEWVEEQEQLEGRAPRPLEAAITWIFVSIAVSTAFPSLSLLLKLVCTVLGFSSNKSVLDNLSNSRCLSSLFYALTYALHAYPKVLGVHSTVLGLPVALWGIRGSLYQLSESIGLHAILLGKCRGRWEKGECWEYAWVHNLINVSTLALTAFVWFFSTGEKTAWTNLGSLDSPMGMAQIVVFMYAVIGAASFVFSFLATYGYEKSPERQEALRAFMATTDEETKRWLEEALRARWLAPAVALLFALNQILGVAVMDAQQNEMSLLGFTVSLLGGLTGAVQTVVTIALFSLAKQKMQAAIAFLGRRG